MLFRLIRAWRRRRWLAEPEPTAWHDWLRADLPFYESLTVDEQRRLRRLARVFIAEKYWEGREGVELTERIQLSIAAQACLLILNLEHDYYRRANTIYIYPTSFGQMTRDGYMARPQRVLGVASDAGPVALAWDASEGGAINPDDGRNVVFHEFAHKLDMLDFQMDGTPPIDGRANFERWVAVMTEHYQKLREDFDAGRRNVLDPYGTQNPAEFFAVATEAFFEKGRTLKRRQPDLYAVLADFYRQNPADWR